MFRNLTDFLSHLRVKGELVEIDAEVSPHLELAEIHRRVIAANGPALLFRNVAGKRFPVVTNLFGSERRVAWAFGKQPGELVRRLASLPEELLPPTLPRLARQSGLAVQLARIGFRRAFRPPVLRHKIAGADLSALPAITSWKEDGGPFITLPLVHTRIPGSPHPDNLGMYRMQIHDARETGMHFQIGKGSGYHLAECEARSEPLPVNVYLGGPPALILAAIAPLPENVPELLLASLVAGHRLGRAPAGAANPDLVAEAEFCLVGEVPPSIRRPEGPFGDHYGYYSLRHDYPVFRPRAIFHRPHAIYPATVVGKPKQEDFYLGDYLQELLSPLFPRVMPAVVDLWSYGETGYHSLAAAILKDRYGREALAAAFRILGEGQLSLTKFLIGTDQQVNLKDFRALLVHVLARVDWAKDLYVFGDTAMDTLDYTGPAVNKGSKGVLLGLGAPRRRLPEAFHASAVPSLVRDVRVFAPGCLVVELPAFAEARSTLNLVLEDPAFAEWPLLVAVDNAAAATKTTSAFLWTTFTRFDPAADIHAAKVTLSGHKVRYQAPVLIDARMKPWYPEALVCDQDTAQLVSNSWRRYFPRDNVVMGDSTEGHLVLPT